ncbi:MAG: family 43 glycosylhydrolase [Lentisphaeria bacterium]|nr:family 43 glycosylhydrolase [Lentisphaeria bacterium]
MAQIMDWIREALHLLGDIVKSSQEFSLCDSLDRLKEYAPVNPVFEHTLKGNAENSYCRTYIAELFDATLFHGSDAPRIQPWAETNYVTDGPFLYQENGKLMMLWSSFGAGGYTMGVAESATGKVTGPWIQHEKPLCDTDGGHGMVFHDLNGKRFYVVHTPNSRQEERPMIIPF